VGELGEWIMLVFWIAFTLIMWLVNWKGKMRSPITFKEDYLVLFLIVGFPIINLVFTLVGGYQKILWLEVLVLIISIVFVIGFLLLSKKQFPKGSSQSHLSL
jgi:antibiotic biosynthesis monooxygenase (ABM) superfamily enzyme